MQGENGLSVFGEQHEIGFPMARGAAVFGLYWPLSYGNTVFYESCRASTAAPTKAAFGLSPRQQSCPCVILGAGKLGMDEAVDGLVAHEGSARLGQHASGNLLGRPAASQAIENSITQGLGAVEF